MQREKPKPRPSILFPFLSSITATFQKASRELVYQSLNFSLTQPFSFLRHVERKAKAKAINPFPFSLFNHSNFSKSVKGIGLSIFEFFFDSTLFLFETCREKSQSQSQDNQFFLSSFNFSRSVKEIELFIFVFFFGFNPFPF